MDIGEAVTRKVGPLPVWVYGALVAVLVWGYYLYSGRSLGGNGTDSLAQASTSDSLSGLPDETGTLPGVSSGTAPTAGGTNSPTDNLAWFTVASNYLVASNLDPVTVSNALNKYLTGEQLTLTERAIVNLAIARYGVPPEGVPVSPGATPTTPTLPAIPGGAERGGMPAPSPRPANVGTPHLHNASAGSTSVTAAWYSAGNATGYTVYLNGAAKKTVTGTSAVVTGLKKDTSYVVTVAALNHFGLPGSQSNPLTVKTKG
jgi:hypothetical protein